MTVEWNVEMTCRERELQRPYLVHDMTIHRDNVGRGNHRFHVAPGKDVRGHVVRNNCDGYSDLNGNAGCQSGSLEVRASLRTVQRYPLSAFLCHKKDEPDQGLREALGHDRRLLGEEVNEVPSHLARRFIEAIEALSHKG